LLVRSHWIEYPVGLGRQTACTVKLVLDGSELAMATRQPVRPPAKVLGTVELILTSVAGELPGGHFDLRRKVGFRMLDEHSFAELKDRGSAAFSQL
jgi:hypothetical protein